MDFDLAEENCMLQETPGFNVLRRIPTPMQLRLSTRRLQMAALSIGAVERALAMMCEYAGQRITFGVPLAERQAIQWWVADAAAKIRAARLMIYETALKLDRQRDVRTHISIVKVYATEMAWEIADKAMQTFGAMGMTKEMPLQLMAAQARLMRIYDGPSEVHRWVEARDILGLKR